MKDICSSKSVIPHVVSTNISIDNNRTVEETMMDTKIKETNPISTRGEKEKYSTNNEITNPRIIQEKIIQHANDVSNMKRHFLSPGRLTDEEYIIADYIKHHKLMKRDEENLVKIHKLKVYDNNVFSLDKAQRILKSPRLPNIIKQSKNDSPRYSPSPVTVTKRLSPKESSEVFLTDILSGSSYNNIKTNRKGSIDILPRSENGVSKGIGKRILDKDQKRFLEIYRTSPDREEMKKKLKQDKDIPLEEYQNTLVNAMVDELAPESVIDMIYKFNDIRDLASSNEGKSTNHENYLIKKFKLLKDDVENHLQGRKVSRNEEEIDVKRFFKYKKKIIKDENNEKMRKCLPKSLIEKLKY